MTHFFLVHFLLLFIKILSLISMYCLVKFLHDQLIRNYSLYDF